MINRQLLRNKVIQTLYAHFTSGDNRDLRLAETELIHSIDKANDLYHALLTLIVETTQYFEQRIDAGRNKLMPTPEELNPNVRFIENRFVAQLKENLNLQEYTSFSPFTWLQFPSLMKEIANQIEQENAYIEYMKRAESSYDLDKDIWRKIFKSVLPRVEHLTEIIEDQSIYWADDLDVEVSFVIKTIKLFKQENNENQGLPLHSSIIAENIDTYIEDKEAAQAEDIRYAKKLLSSVIVNDNKFTQTIAAVTQNWTADRIVLMDSIIIKAAIAELLDFPTIPVNVTLNEYIDLAKIYSTKRSSTFVNGVLDRILSDLKQENKLQKVGLI